MVNWVPCQGGPLITDKAAPLSLIAYCSELEKSGRHSHTADPKSTMVGAAAADLTVSRRRARVCPHEDLVREAGIRYDILKNACGQKANTHFHYLRRRGVQAKGKHPGSATSRGKSSCTSTRAAPNSSARAARGRSVRPSTEIEVGPWTPGDPGDPGLGRRGPPLTSPSGPVPRSCQSARDSGDLP